MNITWVAGTKSATTRVNNYDIYVKHVTRDVYNIAIIRRDNPCLQYERDIECDSMSFAMMEAHRVIELNPVKFISPNFVTSKKSIKGYKAVLIWNSKIHLFGLRVIEVRIPKGTIVHVPRLESIDVVEKEMFKYRAQDAIITGKFASYEKGLSLFVGELIAQTCPRVLINCLVSNFDSVKGHYSTGMKVHIPDFSWQDAECAEGFHFFTSKAEAERYMMYYYALAAKLNDIIVKEAQNDTNN